jgi:hypothetical protein
VQEKKMTFIILLLVIFSFLGINGHSDPYQIPDFSPFTIGTTTATIIPIFINENKLEKTDENIGCVQKIIADIHQNLDNLRINYKNFSSIISDQRKYTKMCSEYLTLKQNFNDCPKPLGFIYKNGIISFLEIVCRIKKDSIISNRECIIEMEASAFQSCQQACISQDYKGFDVLADVKNVELRCSVSACISRCINEQIRECGDSKSLGQLYNEVSGAQMLLGVEQVYGASSKQTSTFLGFEKVPTACRRLILRSVIAAGNFESRSTISDSTTKDITKSF